MYTICDSFAQLRPVKRLVLIKESLTMSALVLFFFAKERWFPLKYLICAIIVKKRKQIFGYSFYTL